MSCRQASASSPAWMAVVLGCLLAGGCTLAPVSFQGLPVWCDPATAKTRELPGRLQVDFTPTKTTPLWSDMLVLPEQLGWQRRFSPLICAQEAIYVQGELVVHIDPPQLAHYRITIYTGAAGREFLVDHPEKVSRTAVVPTGCLILIGRYLRPPYRVELAEDEIRVNGVLLEKFNPGPDLNREITVFEGWVDSFKNRCLKVRCKSRSGKSKWYATDEEVEALLTRIDEILTSQSSREEKLRRLKDDPALDGYLSICPEEALDHWDGYR